MGYRLCGFLLALCAAAQSPDDAYRVLDHAYAHLREKNYSTAADEFRQTLALAPGRADVRKDLAYTLLKIGENEAAREEFAEAMRTDPTDDSVALEYAFLCYETGQKAEARRVFDRLRKSARAQEHRATAAEAFENIDRPLREGIARWQAALVARPGDASAHEELARLAEQRDEGELAARHFEQAWRLLPARRDLLLAWGRALQAASRAEEADAVLLSASRSADSPRVSEQARRLLPARYPYVYEFEKALALDPSNAELRRELAYLHLQMKHSEAAEEQFAKLVEQSPGDVLSAAQLGFLRMNRGDPGGAVLLDRVLAQDDGEIAGRVREALHLPKTPRTRPPEAREPQSEVKLLAEKSLEQGYLADALTYLHAAHEVDPADFNVMLKLGRTYNVLHDDEDAVRWFARARHSEDPAVAREASRAYRNLEPALRRVHTTFWAFPVFSSRWHDTFAYAQLKTEFAGRGWVVRPYVSLRLIGDTRGAIVTAGLGPQYLSERSAIAGGGLATRSWRGFTAWFEAGEAIGTAHLVPDFRGGAAFARGIGGVLAQGRHGWFAETNDDAVFVSRFGNDTLLYSQNRTGYTWRSTESAGGFHAQMYWNWNITGDVQGQPWANFAEAGPGVRFRFESMPQPVMFTVNAVHGTYLVPQGGLRRANFNDLRIGLWYAFTH
jgi:Tfp pilus assembly protein PilF